MMRSDSSAPSPEAGNRRMWPNLVWTFAVLLFLVLQVSPLVNRVTEDESTLVCDAQRIVVGQIPYRDFFGLWAPGGYYVFSGGPWGWWGHPETGCRYLQVAMVPLFTLCLALSLVRWGKWAWPLAALLVVALFPMCAFMGNHWFAVMAYAVAILLAARLWEARGGGGSQTGSWIGMGSLAALAGWFLQTQGFLALVLVLMTLLLLREPPGTLPRKAFLAACGALGSSALLLLPVLLAGGGGSMVRDALLWPLANYRKPGNVADVPLLDGLADRVTALCIRPEGANFLGWILGAVAGGVLYGALLLGLAGLLIASLRHLGRVVIRRETFATESTTASVLTVLTLLLFWRVNPAWVHLIYAMAPILVLWCLVPSKSWHERWCKVYGPALCGLLVFAALYHSRSYLEGPHAWWELVDVDRVDRESALNRSLRALPFMRTGDTIAVLPFGGNTYLYTYPPAVGYTQLFVLELDHHTLEDHSRAAQEIAQHRPKLVLFHAVSEASFMAPQDPISKAIRNGYTRWTQTPGVVAYLRKDLMANGHLAPGRQREGTPP